MRISDWSSDVCSSDLLTGSPATKQHIDELLGWLFDHQQAPPEGDPVTGAWTHSWQAHEGDSYDPATDVRGASPWMSVNIVGGLWRAWLVTHDERIQIGRAHSELQSLMRISYDVFCW